MHRYYRIISALILTFLFNPCYCQTKCDVSEIYSLMHISEVSYDAKALVNGSIETDVSILVPTSLEEGIYELQVRKEDSNLYRILYKDLIIETKYCYEYASYSEDVLLKWESNYGYTKGSLIFDYD